MLKDPQSCFVWRSFHFSKRCTQRRRAERETDFISIHINGVGHHVRECTYHVHVIMQEVISSVALLNWQYIIRICTTFVDVFPSCLTAGVLLRLLKVYDQGS